LHKPRKSDFLISEEQKIPCCIVPIVSHYRTNLDCRMQVDFVGLSEIIRDGSEVPTHPYLWIWGMTAPRLISGSHKVQTFIKKIIVPNFPYLPHCHFCPEKGPGWLVKLYFCIHWMSVLHCCCGAFPGAGIGWASGGEDFWKIFPLCWTSDVKDH